MASALGFERSWAVTGQTYPRKQDSQVLAALAGIGETCHKLGTDLRLLQGTGELSEPFGDAQVGSSAMAYKRNPIRAERMCGLARRLLTDALNGPLNAATQWLERSLDDSANRRLVIEDAFLTADAVVHLAAGIVRGLRVNESVIAARVARELPFMATETILMEAVVRGGDRQELHERLRRYSLEAQEAIAHGRDNPLIDRVASDARLPPVARRPRWLCSMRARSPAAPPSRSRGSSPPRSIRCSIAKAKCARRWKSRGYDVCCDH